MSSIKLSRLTARSKQRGQGMTEYIIIVALVAIAAIGVYSAFGRTVQEQMAAITESLAGQNGAANTDVGTAKNEGAQADKDANAKLGLDVFTKNDTDQ